MKNKQLDHALDRFAALHRAVDAAPLGPSMCNVRCGQCQHEADLGLFCSTPVSGELAPGSYQCPKCKHAWKIVKGKITITDRRTLINEPNRIVTQQALF